MTKEVSKVIINVWFTGKERKVVRSHRFLRFSTRNLYRTQTSLGASSLIENHYLRFLVTFILIRFLHHRKEAREEREKGVRDRRKQFTTSGRTLRRGIRKTLTRYSCSLLSFNLNKLDIKELPTL